jgi:hypothetical protein
LPTELHRVCNVFRTTLTLVENNCLHVSKLFVLFCGDYAHLSKVLINFVGI